jgi:hypothetical protein
MSESKSAVAIRWLLIVIAFSDGSLHSSQVLFYSTGNEKLRVGRKKQVD